VERSIQSPGSLPGVEPNEENKINSSSKKDRKINAPYGAEYNSARRFGERQTKRHFSIAVLTLFSLFLEESIISIACHSSQCFNFSFSPG
jgi:hypothetical protein